MGRGLAAGLVLAGLLVGGACREAAPRPSVLVVTLDTTRADRLGCYGRDGAGTPNLDALAARGTVLDRAYTVSPVTLPAHASIFTGTYPVWHGIRDNGSFRLDGRVETLAELLAAGGRRAAAFVAAYPVASGFGLEQGFELYDDAFGAEHEDRRFSREERRADAVVAAALDWLGRLRDDEPFFAWVHVFDPHAVYEPPAPYDARFANDLYQGEIAFADDALGALFRWLDTSGRAARTVVVVVGDHGEGLGDHGEETHGALIHDSTMRVPLIVAGPGVPGGRRDDRIVRVIDLLPTVAELAGVAVPEAVQGRSLVDGWNGGDDAPREAYLESLWPKLQHGWSEMRGVVSGDWKLIEAPDATGVAPELYRIVADPGERDDLHALEPGTTAGLTELMARLRETNTAEDPFDAARGLTAEDREKLRALGYTGGVDPRRLGRHPRDMVKVLGGYVLVANELREGRLREALRVLDGIERLDPDGLGLHEHRGMVYQDLGRRGDRRALGLAVEEFRRALAINPRREDIWMNLGEVYRALDDPQQAIECYERAMAIAPVSDDVEINYAGLLATVGRLDDAVARLEALLGRRPDIPRAHLTLGVIEAARGKPERALAAFDEAIALYPAGDPGLLTAHKAAGLLCEQSERNGDALRHYEAAAAIDPADPGVRAAIDRLRSAAGA